MMGNIASEFGQLNLGERTEDNCPPPLQESNGNNEQRNDQMIEDSPAGDPPEKEGEATSAPEAIPGEQDVELTVNVHACVHLLDKSRYSARKNLSAELDVNNGIYMLAKQLSLDFQLWVDIWRCCNGGTCPAMGMICKLAQTKLTKLRELKEYALEAEPERSEQLVSLINSNANEMDTRLDELPFMLLDQLATAMSANPYPVYEQSAALWKSIADVAGIEIPEIDVLNLPADQSRHQKSMTEEFIRLVGQRYPMKKIAWFANGLKEIGMIRLLLEQKMFENCRAERCIEKK